MKKIAPGALVLPGLVLCGLVVWELRTVTDVDVTCTGPTCVVVEHRPIGDRTYAFPATQRAVVTEHTNRKSKAKTHTLDFPGGSYGLPHAQADAIAATFNVDGDRKIAFEHSSLWSLPMIVLGLAVLIMALRRWGKRQQARVRAQMAAG